MLARPVKPAAPHRRWIDRPSSPASLVPASLSARGFLSAFAYGIITGHGEIAGERRFQFPLGGNRERAEGTTGLPVRVVPYTQILEKGHPMEITKQLLERLASTDFENSTNYMYLDTK